MLQSRTWLNPIFFLVDAWEFRIMPLYQGSMKDLALFMSENNAGWGEHTYDALLQRIDFLSIYKQ